MPSTSTHTESATRGDHSHIQVAVIGLGEAGTIYAAALARAGYTVTGTDPVVAQTPVGIVRSEDSVSAVAEADLVLVLTNARAARFVATEVFPAMKLGSVYADMTSSQPGAKRALSELPGASQVNVADVAVLGAVSALREKTPLMVSGAAAEEFASVLRTVGASVECIGSRIGAAMDHKLIRSVFSKGIASLAIEAVTAGREAGIEDWVRRQIGSYLADDDEVAQATIDRWLTSTPKHAARRSAEMRDVAELLTTLEVPDDMTVASAVQMEAMTSKDTAS